MQAQGPRQGVRSEINVTPLVDVCLVLLIIFMLIMPTLVREIPVQLPVTGPGKPPASTEALQVSMLEDETLLVEKRPVSLTDLPAVLSQLREVNPDRPVIVQGDRRLRYEQLSRVLDKLDHAGFNRVGLVTVRSAGGN